MKKRILFSLSILLAFVCVAHSQERVKCGASINGFQIKTVYITGNHFPGVAWAYKHIADATCLTPVTDPAKADAVLEISANALPDSESSGPLTVTCSSRQGVSSCVDSDGNELDLDCDRAGNCSSYYGPSIASATHSLIDLWISSAWYQSEARLYTADHKLIWKSDRLKGNHWYDLWPDKLRESTFRLDCRIPAGKGDGEHFRKWATEKCGVDFDPLVSIDIKANARLARANQKQAEADEMKRNAEEAAVKQASTP